MRLVDRADVDLAATLALCARMGNAGTVLRRLRDRYEDPEADPRAALEYGLCRAMYLLNDPNDSDKGPHQAAAVQAFTRCLEIDPHWWLPRFLRMEINSVLACAVPEPALVPQAACEPGAAGAQPGSATAVPPERDLDALLSLQAGAVEAPPYFVSTHAARLRAALREGAGPAAAGAVAEFAASAAAVGGAPCRLPLPYLDLPFRESVLLLRHLGHDAAADSVKATGLAVYPRSLPLQLA